VQIASLTLSSCLSLLSGIFSTLRGHPVEEPLRKIHFWCVSG